MSATAWTALTSAAARPSPESSLSAHRLHLVLLLGVWLVALLVWQFADHRRRRRVERGQDPDPLLPGLGSTSLALVAAATAGGGLVHLAVTPEHFEESTTYGVFFLALGILQIVWSATLLHRPSLALLRLGGVVSAGVVVLWFDTRFVGVGLGPLEAGREAFGAIDLLATGFEVWLVVYAVRHARSWSTVTALRRSPVVGPVHSAAHGSAYGSS